MEIFQNIFKTQMYHTSCKSALTLLSWRQGSKNSTRPSLPSAMNVEGQVSGSATQRHLRQSAALQRRGSCRSVAVPLMRSATIVASSSDLPCGCGESPFVRAVVELFGGGLCRPPHSENQRVSPRSLGCAERHFGFHCGAACASRKDGMMR